MIFKKIFDKIGDYLAKGNRLHIYKEREDAAYNELMDLYKKEASYYTGREVTEDEILQVGRKYNEYRESERKRSNNRRNINRSFDTSTVVDTYCYPGSDHILDCKSK